MLSKISALSVLGVLAVGFSALPVKADTAVVQQTTQDMYIEGSGNAAVQSSQQVNSIRTRVESRRAPGGSTGVVQDVYQGGIIVGDDNAAVQENSQINVIDQRGRARGHRPNITVGH